MRKNLPLSCLSDVKYGVLGLGDSSYAKYNFVAKKLHRRIENLGGLPFIKLGLADDQHDWGPDAVVDEWITEMWKTLIEMHPPKNNMFTSPLGNSLPPVRFHVTIGENVSDVSELTNEQGKSNGFYNKKFPCMAQVKENTRVTSDSHFQETRLLKFDISHAVDDLSYAPGDVVMIQPSNLDGDVTEFLDLLPFKPDVPLYCQPIDLDTNFELPQPVTLRHLATKYFDFMSVPKRNFFQLLSHFATNENEQEKLTEFGTPEGTEDRYSYVNRPRRTIMEVLQDFHHTCKDIPLDRIFDLFPLIRPRAFSIASSPSRHRGELHVLVAVVRYKTQLHKQRKGLCSNWMASLKRGMEVPLWIKRGGIRFPDHVPCIMVGPGTGIAPFRSAAHERSLDSSNETTVIFGCRNKEHDFYFRDEWKQLPVKFFAAFSRDQDEKVYVQHKIKENAEYIWHLVNDNHASIFIAGNSKNMPSDVKSAFLDVFRCHGNMTSQEADRYYEDMQRTKRYQQETWS